MKKLYQPQFNHDDMELLTEQEEGGKFLKLKQYRVRHRRYDGSMTGPIEREVFTPPHAAAGILLYDPKRQKIAITEQFRFGALNDERSPWVLEMVMGMIDKAKENPQHTAIREAKEEAGADVQRVVPICDFYPSPGTCAERMYLFCGEVDITTVHGVHGLASEDENIKVVIMTLSEAEQAVKNGTIKAATTIIAIQWLLLNSHSLWI